MAMAKKKTAKKSASKSKTVAGTGRTDGAMGKRADLGAAVSMYFGSLPGWQASLARRLDRVVRKGAPKATGAIKWGMPVYEHHGMLCYIRAQAKYVTLGFYAQGTSLEDPKGLLEGTGKAMRHVKIGAADVVDEKYLGELVRQAVWVNEAG